MDNKIKHIVSDTLKRFVFSCDMDFLRQMSHTSSKEMLSESRSIIKPITKKFDHLKWSMNDEQKQFLDEFISLGDAEMTESNLKYASNKTGIPIENIKSIRNTYGERMESYIKPDVAIGSAFAKGVTAVDLGIKQNELGTRDGDVQTKLFPMDQTGRNKSLQQTAYQSDKVSKDVPHESNIPAFLFEWLTYVLKDDKRLSIIETKVVSKAMSAVKNKKMVRLILQGNFNENVVGGLDKLSTRKTDETKCVEKILSEFNSIFGTNFLVVNQYTGDNGHNNIEIENYQIVDAHGVHNKNPEADFEKQKAARTSWEGMFSSGQIKNGTVMARLPLPDKFRV